MSFEIVLLFSEVEVIVDSEFHVGEEPPRRPMELMLFIWKGINFYDFLLLNERYS